MKLSKAREGFILELNANGYSPRTIEIYEWMLSKLTPFLNDSEVEEITADDLKRFFAHLQRDYTFTRPNGTVDHLKPASILNAWTAMRAFYNWAARELGVKRVDHVIKKPEVPILEILPFTEDDIQKMLKACQTQAVAKTEKRTPWASPRDTALRDTALVLLLLDTGLRVGEVGRLLVKHIELKTGEITVVPWRTGRKARSRHVYIGKSTQKALWRYFAERDAQPDDFAFATREGKTMKRYNTRTLIYRIAERAGVKGVYPHRFRHTFAIQFLRNGGDVFTLQRLLGHSSLDMVKRYVAIADYDSEKAHRRASPVDNWRL